MTVSISQELDKTQVAFRLELLGWLEQTFASAFRLAGRSESGSWHYVAADQPVAGNADALDPDSAAACDTVVATSRPCVVPIDGGGCAVAMPIEGSIPGDRVAVGEVFDTAVDVLERMADLWLTAATGKQQVERLRVETDYFAEQLSDDLEELTFVRSMVEHLDMSDQSNDLLALAESTLPLLNETVRAESLSLLIAPEGIDPLDAIPTISTGCGTFSDVLKMQIVQQFGESAKVQPVVKNRVAAAPEGKLFAGVRELILVPLESRSRQMGWLLALNRAWPDTAQPAGKCRLNPLDFGSSEASLLSTTASILATHASNLDLFREKEQILVSVVRSLVSAIDAKDEYTCGHSERVALFGKILARQAGYDEEQCERLYLTGLLHDVGKIGVSDAVLKKDGKLTDEEFDEIKRHPDEGWAILHDLEQLRYVLPGVLYHHERVDGAGYPDGLGGSDIPLDGRVLAIVDAYDAMTSDRPYRAGMPPERAQEILRSGAGTQWDAELIDHFFTALDQIETVRKNHRLRQRPTRRRGCCS